MYFTIVLFLTPKEKKIKIKKSLQYYEAFLLSKTDHASPVAMFLSPLSSHTLSNPFGNLTVCGQDRIKLIPLFFKSKETSGSRKPAGSHRHLPILQQTIPLPHPSCSQEPELGGMSHPAEADTGTSVQSQHWDPHRLTPAPTRLGCKYTQGPSTLGIARSHVLWREKLLCPVLPAHPPVIFVS